MGCACSTPGYVSAGCQIHGLRHLASPDWRAGWALVFGGDRSADDRSAEEIFGANRRTRDRGVQELFAADQGRRS